MGHRYASQAAPGPKSCPSPFAEHGGLDGTLHHRAQPAECAVAGQLLDDGLQCGSFTGQTSMHATTTTAI
nr:hypothetical protein [Streptomyces harenosi]